MIYTLNEIIRESLIEDGRSTLHKFEQYLPLGIRAVRKLNIAIGSPIKTVYLTPTSYNTIPVPDDYFSYSKIGVCIGGVIYNLGRNDDLCFPHMTNACGQLQPEGYNPYLGTWSDYQAAAMGLDVGWVYWAYTAYNEFGEFTGRLYGKGQGYNDIGYYRFNDQTNEFVLTPGLQAQAIVLEYVTTGVNKTNIIVPEQAIEAVISFVRWKSARGSERAQFKTEFELAQMQLQVQNFAFTLDEFIAAIRMSYSLAPKG